MSATSDIHVDGVWDVLGHTGRYQMYQMIVILISCLPTIYNLVSVVFLGREINHVCNVSETLVNITPRSCGVYQVNASGEDGFLESCNYGYVYAEPKDRSFVSEFDLVCDREPLGRLAQTLIMAGMLFGAIFLPPVADRYGRKLLHVASHIVTFGVSLAMAFVNNLTLFYICKFLIGFLNQSPSACGFLVSVAWSFSLVFIVPVAYLTRDYSWRVAQIVLASFTAFSILEIWLLDESLRWLVANNKEKKVKASIKKAAKMNGKNFEDVWQYIQTKGSQSMLPATAEQESHIDEHKGAVFLPQEHRPEEKKLTILDLVTNKTLRNTTYILCYIWIINSMTYYGLTLLAFRLAGSPYVNFALAGILEIPSCLVMFFLFKRVGRRNTIIFFHLVCGVSLLIVVLVLILAGDTKAASTSQTAFWLIGRFAITGSYKAIWMYTPEVYPTNCRSIAVGLTSSVARIGSMAAPFLKTLADIAVWGPGAIFAFACITVTGLILLLPETKDRELPQTVDDFQIMKEANQKAKRCKDSETEQCH